MFVKWWYLSSMGKTWQYTRQEKNMVYFFMFVYAQTALHNNTMSKSLRIENWRIYALVCRWLSCTIRHSEHCTAKIYFTGFSLCFHSNNIKIAFFFLLNFSYRWVLRWRLALRFILCIKFIIIMGPNIELLCVSVRVPHSQHNVTSFGYCVYKVALFL